MGPNLKAGLNHEVDQFLSLSKEDISASDCILGNVPPHLLEVTHEVNRLSLQHDQISF
jgi:hypothetical protein